MNRARYSSGVNYHRSFTSAEVLVLRIWQANYLFWFLTASILLQNKDLGAQVLNFTVV